MEENEVILLSKCRSRISKSGKWMNLFSIFAAAGMVLMVIAGILLISFGNRFDEGISPVMELITSIAGIFLIVLSAALVYPLVLMRRAVKSSRQVRANMDVTPMLDALAVTHILWKYMTWVVFLCLCFACLAAFLALIFFWPLI